MKDTAINSEWELLNKIKKTIKAKGSAPSMDLVKSIGDDCAAFRVSKNRLGLITTDISIESIHFDTGLVMPEDIGFKALMGSISDITAMGGKAKLAFVSIGIPDKLNLDYILRIYNGMLDAANRAGVIIAGGDTSKSKDLIINITVYGEVAENRLLKRSGAEPGDFIYITGSIGDSRAGLEILQSQDGETGCSDMSADVFKNLTEKHRRPIARFDIINEVIQIFNPTAMIDVSDGLLSDLRHICNESNTGFIVEEETAPLSKEFMKFAAYNNIDQIDQYEYAMGSGEEYELLFTSKKDISEFLKLSINRIAVSRIGKISHNGFCVFRNNKLREISIPGFDHFK